MDQATARGGMPAVADDDLPARDSCEEDAARRLDGVRDILLRPERERFRLTAAQLSGEIERLRRECREIGAHLERETERLQQRLNDHAERMRRDAEREDADVAQLRAELAQLAQDSLARDAERAGALARLESAVRALDAEVSDKLPELERAFERECRERARSEERIEDLETRVLQAEKRMAAFDAPHDRYPSLRQAAEIVRRSLERDRERGE